MNLEVIPEGSEVEPSFMGKDPKTGMIRYLVGEEAEKARKRWRQRVEDYERLEEEQNRLVDSLLQEGVDIHLNIKKEEDSVKLEINGEYFGAFDPFDWEDIGGSILCQLLRDSE